MRILVVASYNKNRYAPFIVEQAEALQRSGCKIGWFGVQGKGITGYLRAIPWLRAKIREFQPDVIHAHYGLSCLLANLATRRVPVISTFHGSDINESFARKLSKIAMHLSAWNIFVSQRIMDLAKAAHRRHCSLIPCGVSLSDEQLLSRSEARKIIGWSTSDKKILFAGAFDNAVKDPELAKASVALLEGVELIELKGYNRQQVNTLMCASNCLLMTSRTEGSPQVIKEAMACGCPIVSVDVGDVAERTEGVDACYVVSTREPRDIADALEKAIAFEGKTKGRERIKDMMLDNVRVAERLIDVYESILNN